MSIYSNLLVATEHSNKIQDKADQYMNTKPIANARCTTNVQSNIADLVTIDCEVTQAYKETLN